jgi:hypothetical protein
MKALGHMIDPVFVATLSNPSASQRIHFTEALRLVLATGPNSQVGSGFSSI